MKKKKVMQIGEMTCTPMPKGMVKLSIGTKSTTVDYKELWGAIFVLSDKERQDAMMPVRKEERMVFSRKHVIKLKKDMQAGDSVVAWCEVSIPETIVRAIAEENGAKVIIRSADDGDEVTVTDIN